MFVADWMTPDPRVIQEDDPIADAWKLFKDCGFHQMPVVDEVGHLVGIITDRDVRTAQGFSDRSGEALRAGEVMTSPVETTSLAAPLEDAIRVLASRSFNALPVVNKRKLAGIITKNDILKAFCHVLGLDQAGRCLEVALPSRNGDIVRAFSAVAACHGQVISAIVASTRDDRDEISLYLRVAEVEAPAVQHSLHSAGLILLEPEHA